MRYFSAEEVAKLLGISKMSIYRYIDEGKLRAIKTRGEFSGRVRIPADAVAEYLEANTTIDQIYKMKKKKNEIIRIIRECRECEDISTLKERIEIVFSIVTSD
jgi:excisionase family DNA binding protein